jgi:hypothetical protein
MPTKKERMMFLCDKETREQLEAVAESEGRSLSNMVERLVQFALKTRAQPSNSDADSKDDDAETLELLIGFLNYLIDNFDHDGYSLAEISQLLGRRDDKGLVALVQKLQSNGTSKPAVKHK